jgi:dTDP-4-amino-4,6-dideoxygalactose transaminase
MSGRSAVKAPPAPVVFNRPSFEGRELEYIAEAVHSGWISGDGAFTKRCQEYLEAELGSGKALLTTSCTDALELSGLVLDLKPGDEVIVPSFTFVSSVNAFALRGAKPVFADVRQDTLNLDERSLESLITERTRAVVVVHYAGVGCEMDSILEVARRHGLAVVEDNAHGLFGRYRGRFLGTFGDLATQSFHETKNFSCGEGGALLLNRRDLVDAAEIGREKGTDRSRFMRGLVDKYTWVGLGSSFLPSDLLAAVLYAQFEKRSEIQSSRERLWLRYQEALGPWAAASGVSLPFVPEHCEQPFHMFYLLAPDAAARDSLLSHLRSHRVNAVFHYVPLHSSPMGILYGGRPGDCPVTEDVAGRLLRLPFYTSMTAREQDRVIEAALDWRT